MCFKMRWQRRLSHVYELNCSLCSAQRWGREPWADTHGRHATRDARVDGNGPRRFFWGRLLLIDLLVVRDTRPGSRHQGHLRGKAGRRARILRWLGRAGHTGKPGEVGALGNPGFFTRSWRDGRGNSNLMRGNRSAVAPPHLANKVKDQRP